MERLGSIQGMCNGSWNAPDVHTANVITLEVTCRQVSQGWDDLHTKLLDQHKYRIVCMMD